MPVWEIRRGVHPATEHEPGSERSAQLLTVNQGMDAPAAPAAAPAPTAANDIAGIVGQDSATGEGFVGVGGLGARKKGTAREEKAKLAGELKSASVLRGLAGKYEVADKDRDKLAQNREVYDPNAIVQTGPGLPSWSWDMASFVFNGPVRQGQGIHLYLAPPWLNLLLSLTRVALLVALALSNPAAAAPARRRLARRARARRRGDAGGGGDAVLRPPPARRRRRSHRRRCSRS